MIRNKISIHDFVFYSAGRGRYKVVYTNPSTKKQWTKMITDMTIIDVTKNSHDGRVKISDLYRLRDMCKTTTNY